MKISTQMCREISVAGTFISCLQFHTKPRMEYLLFEKKKNTLRLCLVNQTFLYCLRLEIVLLRPEFYITAMAGSTTCGRHHVFARFLRICQELSFGSHMRSSWDLPFASSIKTGHHKLGHFDAQLVPEKTWKIQCCTFFSDNSVVFFNVTVYFYPSRFLHRSTLTSQTLNMSIIKKANCEYIVHQLWTRWLAGA